MQPIAHVRVRQVVPQNGQQMTESQIRTDVTMRTRRRSALFPEGEQTLEPLRSLSCVTEPPLPP